MLRALRQSGGGAIAVPEENIEDAAAEMRTKEGVDAGPEGGATLLGYRMLLASGAVRADEVVVLFNTGANKYR